MTIERNQCQAKLDILIEGFMRADWAAYRDAVTWLRDFADQKNIDAGRVMCGGVWSTPRTIEAHEAHDQDVELGLALIAFDRHNTYSRHMKSSLSAITGRIPE